MKSFRSQCHSVILLFKDSSIAAVIITLVLLLPGVYRDWKESRNVYFSIEFESSVNSVAQLYYDIGNALNEGDSKSHPILSDIGFQTVQFQLPRNRIHNLRFDPLKTAGQCVLKNIRIIDGFNREIRRLDIQRIQPLNQIENFSVLKDRVQFKTQAGMGDPMLSLDIPYPVFFNSRAGILAIMNVIVLKNVRFFLAIYLLSSITLMFVFSELKDYHL